jgi:uncharacterized protein
VSGAGVPRIESLSIRGPCGVLEAILRLPAGEAARAALLCHPHPLYGGSLHSPVIYRSARALHRLGTATLRFNFRGVGRSSGSFDGGKGERDDVLCALESLSSRVPGVPVTLLGYSFGSRVGFEAAAADPRVSELVGIALPVSLWPFDFLKAIHKPLIVIQGSEDIFGPLPPLKRLLEDIGEGARLVVLRGADHFLNSDLERLEETLYLEMGGRRLSG